MSVSSTESLPSSSELLAHRVISRLRPQPVATPLDYAERLTIELDPWQRRVLESKESQLLLNVTRQGGKSTISSLLGISAALAKPDQLILIVSPGERQSKLLFKKLLRFYYQLGRPVLPKAENKLSLELRNGSEIHALPGDEDTIRGFSGVDLLLVDEASRVEDALMAAVRPMLATSNGRLVAMSTPWGKRGWWYEAWAFGGDDWERYEVPVTMCPRIPPEFVEREKRSLPPLWFDSEYMCNPPEAPIWMGDFSFQPIGDVKVGDTVVGWAPRPHRDEVAYPKQRLTRGVVLGTQRRLAELVEIRLASGETIVCTPDHRWLTTRPGYPMTHYEPAQVGQSLARIIARPRALEQDLQWDAAWLGGVYDGEGSGNVIGQSQSHNPDVHARIVEVAERLGFSTYVTEHQIGLYAGDGSRNTRQAMVDFLHWTRPTRRPAALDRLILNSHFRKRDEVVSITPIGTNEVVSLQTTTGNYVVWGYGSKNCQFVDPENALFSSAQLDRAFGTNDIVPLFPVTIDEEPVEALQW